MSIIVEGCELHRRRSMRSESWDYSWPGWYYVTICTHDRRCLFGEVCGDEVVLNQLGRLVEEEWLRTAMIRAGVDLDAYVIMPNHLHGIIALPHQDRPKVVGATRRVAPTRYLKPLPA